MLSVSCSLAATAAFSLISVAAAAAAAAILHTLLWLLCSGLPLWFFRAAWGKKKIQPRFHLSLTSPVPHASLPHNKHGLVLETMKKKPRWKTLEI